MGTSTAVFMVSVLVNRSVNYGIIGVFSFTTPGPDFPTCFPLG